MSRIVVVVALVAAVLVGSHPAYACSCIPTSTAAKLEAATAVFSATADVVAERAVILRVHEVYRGEVASSVRVGGQGGPTSFDSCAVQFVEEERYIVFALADGDALTTHICSGTTQDLTVASELGEPTMTYVADFVVAEPVRDADRTGPIAAAVLLLVVTAGWTLRVLRARSLAGRPADPSG